MGEGMAWHFCGISIYIHSAHGNLSGSGVMVKLEEQRLLSPEHSALVHFRFAQEGTGSLRAWAAHS